MTLTTAIPLTIKRIAIFLYCIFRGGGWQGLRRRVHPRTRAAGGARWRQVVEDHAGNVGRGWSKRSERSPTHPYHPPGITICT